MQEVKMFQVESYNFRAITVNGKVTVSLQSDGCRGTNNEVIYLEHVQAVVSLTATRRGQVSVTSYAKYDIIEVFKFNGFTPHRYVETNVWLR